MNAMKINPIVREVALYERLSRSEECIAYDARLIYAVSGELTVTLREGKPVRIGPGELIYIPAGMPYRLRNQLLCAVVVSFDITDEYPSPEGRIPPSVPSEFDPSRLHTPPADAPFNGFIHLKEQSSEEEGLLRMCNIFTSAYGNYLATLSAMLKLLLLKILEASDENALPSRLVESLDGYIRENASEELSNTELGAVFGYHPFYISKLIKDKKGITLHQYVISYRLKTAASMLRLTDRSVSDIAERTGFTDASYFTKTFKGIFGMTPKEYRNKHKEDFI